MGFLFLFFRWYFLLFSQCPFFLLDKWGCSLTISAEFQHARGCSVLKKGSPAEWCQNLVQKEKNKACVCEVRWLTDLANLTSGDLSMVHFSGSFRGSFSADTAVSTPILAIKGAFWAFFQLLHFYSSYVLYHSRILLAFFKTLYNFHKTKRKLATKKLRIVK